MTYDFAARRRPARLRGWLERHGIELFVALMLLAVLSATAMAAEVTFTASEMAALKGDAGEQGPPGPAGADGAPGTRITELAGVCSAAIGAQVFEWPCTAAGVVPEPEPEPPIEPDPPADGGSVNNGDGTVTLVWLAPTEYTDGTPIEPGAISKYRVYSQRSNEDWTYDGQTTTATIRLTASGCYTMEAFVGQLRSARSNEVCLR